jgi:hypothetical protein
MNDRESHLEALWRTMSATYTASESSDLLDQFTHWWSLRDSKTRSPDDLTGCAAWLSRLPRVVRPNSRIFFTQSGRVGLTREHASGGRYAVPARMRTNPFSPEK